MSTTTVEPRVATAANDIATIWSARVLGPGAVFAALAIGSGELVFWPQLALSYGVSVLAIAVVALLVQYVINVEVGRYSLVTGESIVVGATRRSSVLGVMLLLGAVVPWLWPGWARAASQVITVTTGAPEPIISVVSLVVCGLILSVPRRVYPVVERLQSILLAVLLGGVVIVALFVWTQIEPAAAVASAGGGAIALLGTIVDSSGSGFLALLSGIVFVGAGGILNIGYGLMLCEKQFAMGKYAQPLHGLRHSFGLSAASGNAAAEAERMPESYWRRWVTFLRQEHALMFVCGNLLTLATVSMILHRLLGGAPKDVSGMKLLELAIARLNEAGGPAISGLFIVVCWTAFFTSELGILDITSRIAAGIASSGAHRVRMNPSTWFHVFVWLEILIGIAIVFVDPRQPYWFLVTSGFLNTFVMALYCGILVRENGRLPRAARPSWLVRTVLAVAAGTYATFFIVTMVRF